MRFTLLAAAALVVAFTQSASAQQSDRLPQGFENCTPEGAAIVRDYRRSQLFQGCAPSTGAAEEYGRVFVQFSPPDDYYISSTRGSRGRRALNALRRFFAPSTRSGSLIATLTLVQGGQELPLDVVTLATFTLDERGRLTVNNASGQGANDVGYRFRINDQTRVRVEFAITQSREITSNIVQDAQTVSETLSSLGYVPAAAAATLLAQPSIREIEQRIAGLAGGDRLETATVDLSFDPAGYSGVRHGLRMFETLPTGARRAPDAPFSGMLFVGLRRDVTAFSIPSALAPISVDGGQVNFNMNGHNLTNYGPVLRGLIGGESLEAHLQEAMGNAWAQLSSDDPGNFEIGCTALQTALRDEELGLATQDIAIGSWAAIVQHDNAHLPTLRGERSCLGSQIPAYENLGLPLPQRALTAIEQRNSVGGYLDGYQDDLTEGLQGAAGFSDHFATVANGGDERWPVSLRSGVSYTILGACETGCANVDLELIDPEGNIVASDRLTDDYPMLRYTPSEDGSFTILIHMARCARQSCLTGTRILQPYE